MSNLVYWAGWGNTHSSLKNKQTIKRKIAFFSRLFNRKQWPNDEKDHVRKTPRAAVEIRESKFDLVGKNNTLTYIKEKQAPQAHAKPSETYWILSRDSCLKTNNSVNTDFSRLKKNHGEKLGLVIWWADYGWDAQRSHVDLTGCFVLILPCWCSLL